MSQQNKINEKPEVSTSTRPCGKHGHLKWNGQTETCEGEKKNGQGAGRRIKGLWFYGS